MIEVRVRHEAAIHRKIRVELPVDLLKINAVAIFYVPSHSPERTWRRRSVKCAPDSRGSSQRQFDLVGGRQRVCLDAACTKRGGKFPCESMQGVDHLGLNCVDEGEQVGKISVV